MGYEGFQKLEKSLAAKGVENPGGLAASIGRKKYGPAAFQKSAAAGKKMSGAKPQKPIRSVSDLRNAAKGTY